MFSLTIALITLTDHTSGGFFGELYRDYWKKSYAIIFGIVKNHHDAEEIAQETFMKIYRAIERVNNLPREEIAPFIVICSRNAALDFLDKKERQVGTVGLTYDDDGEEKEYEVPDDSPLPDEIVVNKERAMKLGGLIDSLPEKQRHVIMMRFKYGFSEKETAEIMHMTESAVSSSINRAKKSLRGKIGGVFDE